MFLSATILNNLLDEQLLIRSTFNEKNAENYQLGKLFRIQFFRHFSRLLYYYI